MKVIRPLILHRLIRNLPDFQTDYKYSILNAQNIPLFWPTIRHDAQRQTNTVRHLLRTLVQKLNNEINQLGSEYLAVHGDLHSEHSFFLWFRAPYLSVLLKAEGTYRRRSKILPRNKAFTLARWLKFSRGVATWHRLIFYVPWIRVGCPAGRTGFRAVAWLMRFLMPYLKSSHNLASLRTPFDMIFSFWNFDLPYNTAHEIKNCVLI